MKTKKLFVVALAIVSLCLMVCLTACGNHELGFGSYNFHFVHIQMYNMDEPVHLEVDKWKGDEGGIELATKRHGTILLGDGTYMMYDQEACPICGEVAYI